MYEEKRKDGSFLSYNLKLMRTIGLWPLDSNSYMILFMYAIYTALLAISLALVSVGQVVEIFVSPNISSMASAVDLVTLTSSALFKLVYLVVYHNDFRKLVNKIDSTYVESNADDSSFTISNYTKRSKPYINIYVAASAVTLCGFFVIIPYLTTYIPVLETPVSFGSSSQNQLSTSDISSMPVVKKRKFPFNCWFPFDVAWSPIYELVFLLEIFPLFGSGHLYLVSDSFFFMIIYLTCGQFEILKTSLRNISAKYEALSGNKNKFDPLVVNSSNGRISPLVWELYEKEKEFEHKLNCEIIKCVDFHCKLIEIIHDLDRLLRSMIVVDFLHAVISLSFALLQTITSSSLYEWMQMLLFIPVCILHQFLNNYFSDMLMQQQTSVGEVMYEIPWPESPSTLKTAVMLTTAQARNTMQLSGWRMYWLGLPTFVEFMKLLGSYFLVLQSLHDDEKKHGP